MMDQLNFEKEAFDLDMEKYQLEVEQFQNFRDDFAVVEQRVESVMTLQDALLGM